MVELDHLSYSSISLYQTCPRAWRYRYVEKIPTPASASLAFGSAFHSAIETIIARRAIDQPVEPVAAWTAAWEVATQQEIDYQGELPEELSNQGLRLLTHKDTADLLNSIVPMLDADGQPVIEKRVELRVPGVPVPIIGYIDTILSNGIPADFKTSTRAWTEDKAREELQPAYYLAALNQMGYSQNPSHEFQHFVFVKTKVPQIQIIPTVHPPADWLWLFGAVQEVWRGIEAGVFPPNPGSWRCSERYCEYWSRCRGRP